MTAHNLKQETGAGYLWDRSHPVDADIARLERDLAPLRYRAAPFTTSDHHSSTQPMAAPMARRVPLRAAAALALFIAGIWAVSLFSIAVNDAGAVKTVLDADSLKVTALGGSPRIGGKIVCGSGSLRAGQWIETDTNAQAEITVAQYGTVKVEAGSRIRLVSAKEKEQRLQLARGSLSAMITAPPRLFVVDTPAASAIDLGCAYRMNVDDSGSGEIAVTLGWVSMETGDGREPSVVPWGARCLTRKGHGVGTPFYGDATVGLRRALEQFDFENGGTAALQTVLAEAREDDSLTLWHLLARSDGDDRGLVFERLAAFAPPPADVTRERVMAGDTQALLAWRDTFMWSPNLPTSRVP